MSTHSGRLANAVRRLRTAVAWARLRELRYLGTRSMRVMRGQPTDTALPLVMCLWARPDRLAPMLQMVRRQQHPGGVRLLLWNNARGNHAHYRRVIDQLGDLGSIRSIELHSAWINIGGVARFVVARMLRRAGYRGPVVMLDDDQDIPSDFVADLLDGWDERTYSGVWAWRIHGDYWDREGVLPGEAVSYVGTGGSICSVDLLAQDAVLDGLDARHMFLEDIWLSACAHRRGYRLTRSTARFTFDDPDADAQWIGLAAKKSRYYDLLGRPGSMPR